MQKNAYLRFENGSSPSIFNPSQQYRHIRRLALLAIANLMAVTCTVGNWNGCEH